MTKSSLKLPSFAKINWYLRILGKRPDGYHELITALQTVSLHDDLVFDLREDGNIKLVCDHPEIPVDDNNLIVKAARALQEHLNSKLGADIKLTKRIPTQAGLGGASSNAALALLALNALWADRSEDALECGGLTPLWPRSLFTDTKAATSRRTPRSCPDANEPIDAGSLGADVPFFLEGGTSIATGTGTKLSPRPDGPKQHLIIITPNAKISTAKAYASLNAAALTTSESASILSSSLADVSSADSRQWPLRNDFERVIFEIEPEIERAKMALLEAGARGALLAGSGSSVFGVFDDEAARDRGLENLRSEAGWKVFSCHTLSREEYFRAMNSSGFPLFTLS